MPNARNLVTPRDAVTGQRAAMLKFFEGTTPAYAECGACGAFHPVPYLGDCRNDLFRVYEPDALHGADGWKLESE